jgi:hypothetical protein
MQLLWTRQFDWRIARWLQVCGRMGGGGVEEQVQQRVEAAAAAAAATAAARA